MDISDIVNQLKKEFLDSFPEKINLIQALWSKKDFKSLEMEFHKFKGIGSTYSFPEITEMGQIVEFMLKNKNPSIEKAIAISIEILKLIHSPHYEANKAIVADKLTQLRTYQS